MNKINSFLFSTVFLATFTHADIIIDVRDASTEGFNDRTIVSPVGGNPGNTIGEQRLAVFERAADILEEKLDIPVDVRVRAEFNSLTCNSSYGMLGWAGPEDIEYTLEDRTAIPHALYNQLIGEDKEPGYEITVEFNSRIDNNDSCLYDTNWYYGFDEPTGNDISLLTTALHELMHGMGFLSLMPGDGSFGAWWNDGDGNLTELFDPFSVQLIDATNGERLIDQTPAQRRQTLRDDGNLVWAGTLVNSYQDNFSDGFNNGQAKIYAPSSYDGGSSTSHFDVSMFPDETMEPNYTVFDDDPGLAIAALIDIGWSPNPANLPNYAPVLAAISDQTTLEDTPLSLTLSATDENNDSLTFSAETVDDNLSVSLTSSSLTLTPAENFEGIASVIVRVTDGENLDVETINVTVTPVNDAPHLTSPGDQTIEEDTLLDITLSGNDVDNSELSYYIVSAASELNADLNSNTLTITPTLNYNGENSVSIGVSDGELTDEVTFTVTVNAVDDAPILANIGNQILAEDSALHIPLSAIDVDGDPFIFEVVQAVSELNATISGNALNIEPVADYYGSSEVTVRAAGSLSSDQETFTVTVSAENDAPQIAAISDQSVATDTPLTISLEGSDVDGDSLTYMASSSDESVILTAIDGASLTLSAASEYNGSAVITVIASDGELSATTDFTATVSGGQDIAPLSISVNGEDVQDDATLLLSALESATLSAAGGNGIYEFNAVFDGSIRSDLLTGSGTTRTLMAPEDGAFAGTYAITIDDTHGSSTPVRFSIRRPLILSTDVTPLLEGTRTAKLIIEGGSIGERITLAASELDFIDNEGELANDLPGPTENAAEGYNAVSALIDAAEPGDYQLVAESAGTGSTELDVTVVAARTLNLSVIDAQGLAIESAVVSLTDERINQWGLTESYTSASAEYVDRQFAIRLPALTQEIRIDAKGFDSQIISSDTSETSKIVELSLADGFFHLSGKVLSEGIDFSAEAPELIITLANGNTTTPDSVKVLSAKELEVEWVTELAVADPVSITISHSQSDDVVINLDDALGKQQIEAILTLKEISESPENNGSDSGGSGSSGGSGGGNAAWLLVTALALVGRRRLKAA